MCIYISIYIAYLFFVKKKLFRVGLGSQQNSEGSTEISDMIPAPPTCRTSPIINIPHQTDTFVTTDKPTFIHHFHPKSVVHIRVHSWSCAFYGFGQMYTDMYPPL